MTLPYLQNWPNTAHRLHRGVSLLGAIQRLTQPPQPAYLELGLRVLPRGLSTGALPSGGRVVLDFTSASLRYTPAGGEQVIFPLDGHSQSAVFTNLFGLLATRELADVLPPGEDLFARLSAGVAAKEDRYRPPAPETMLDQERMEIDLRTAGDYLKALQIIFTGIARFKARLLGLMTPLVVWPEHFDLSTLWFVGKEIDESQPHMNFGFAPYSEGIEYPYLYAYAYPYPEKYDPPALPQGARWHTQGWTGVVLPYAVIAAQSESMAFVEESCMGIYDQLMSLIPG